MVFCVAKFSQDSLNLQNETKERGNTIHNHPFYLSESTMLSLSHLHRALRLRVDLALQIQNTILVQILSRQYSRIATRNGVSLWSI